MEPFLFYQNVNLDITIVFLKSIIGNLYGFFFCSPYCPCYNTQFLFFKFYLQIDSN